MNLNGITAAVAQRRAELAAALGALGGIAADAERLAAGDLRPFFAWHLARLDHELAELGERVRHQRESHESTTARIREEARERVSARRTEIGSRRELSPEQADRLVAAAECEADAWADAEIEADANRQPRGLRELEERHEAKSILRAELAKAADSATLLDGADAERAARGYVATMLCEATSNLDVRPGPPETAAASGVDTGGLLASLVAAAVKTA